MLSNPEFLAEGTAIRDLEAPDRVLIGGEDSASIDALASIYAQWVPQQQIPHQLWSSEFQAHRQCLSCPADQLDQLLPFAKPVGQMREVARAIGTDSRIGAKSSMLGPVSVAVVSRRTFSTWCTCRHFGLPEVADYWESVVARTPGNSKYCQAGGAEALRHSDGEALDDFGFAFKADTNDTREAPAIRICRDLLEEGAQLVIHDPKVMADQMAQDLNQEPAFRWIG